MEEKVSNRQIFFIIFITLSAFSVTEIAKTMAKSAGTGAWVPLLLGAIFFSFSVAVTIYLGTIFKGKTLFEYSGLLLGKPLTYVFTFIYILYFLGILSMLLRSGAEIIKLEILEKTPAWAIMLVLLFFSANAASKGISNLGSIFEFIGYILIIVIIGFSIQMFLFGDKINVLPLFDVSEINSYLKAIPLVVMPYLGFEVFTIIPLSKRNGKKAIWYSVIAVIAVYVFYLLVVYLTYMLLGVEDTKYYIDALFVGIRLLNIDMFQFLRRFDIIAFMQWISIMFCSLAVVIFALKEYTCKLFSKVNGNIILIFVSIIVFIIALLPTSYDMTTQIFTYVTLYFGLIPAFLIPNILLIMAKVKKY